SPLRLLAVASLALIVVGCATRRPAPVEERQAPPRGARAPSPPADTAAAPAPAPNEATRPEAPANTYTVKRGDTPYQIALDNGLDYRELAAWNNITDPAAIKAGLVLRMRPPGQAVAAQAEGGAQVQPEARVQVQPVTVPGSVEARSLGAD